MSDRPSVLSLFTGVGGLDYGFEAAGFDTRVALEMDRACCESLRATTKWQVMEANLLPTSTSEILNFGNLNEGEVDVLIGGPPCQPFSKSGWWKSGGSLRLEDPRADTLTGYLRVLKEARPRAFLLENVEGLKFGGKDEGLQLLLTTIERINAEANTAYHPTVISMNAADYGVPQTRTRVFVIGARDGKIFQKPPRTHRDPLERDESTQPWLTAWDAIGHLEEPEDPELRVTGKWADLLPTIPEGMNYLWHTDRMSGESLFGWRRRYWNFLLKLAKDRPAWTIQAQPGPATGPFHWRNRKLSATELARLQTFPTKVRIHGSRGDVQRQVGNAVPSLLAEVLAREIRKQLLGMRLRSPLRLLPVRAPCVPPPERPGTVPRKYLQLNGQHAPHPGTGRGYLYQEANVAEPA